MNFFSLPNQNPTQVFFKNLIQILAVLGVLFLASCSESKNERGVRIVSMSVIPSPLVVSGIGSSYQFSLIAELSDGSKVESLPGVVWTSSKTALATIDNMGLMTVHAMGDVDITANYFGISGTSEVNVVEITSLSVYPSRVEATALNQTFLLSVIGKDNTGLSVTEITGITWESADQTIATVDEFGEVTTHAEGAVLISASYGDITVQSQLTVNQSGIVIEGAARYEDKLYSTTGFTGYNFKAIRYATVELLDENETVIGYTATDETGHYRFGNVVPDQFSVRLIAEVPDSPAAGFSVNDMDGATYSFTKLSVNNSLQYNFDLTRDSSGAGAFNLLDVAVISAQYASQVLDAEVSNLQIYWEKGYELAGTYYCVGYDASDCFNDKGIYILSQVPNQSNGGAADTDEFDDDVIMHEFGHFLTANYSVDDSIGGPHLITQNDSDLRLSWSEGWGTFFPSAVKHWLISPEVQKTALISSQAVVTTYVDTIGNVRSLQYDIKTGEIGDGFYYATSEAAVSRILWNLLEAFGMPKIWDVLVNYFPTATQPTSLPVFWDGLLASDFYSPNELGVLNGIFSEREVHYSNDSAETDNTLATATIQAVDTAPTVTNTLYSDALLADVDFFAFSATAGTTYKVSTIDLYNGTDTAIRLFDADERLLAENDDANPGLYLSYDPDVGATRVRNSPTAMASEIQFTASYTGQYYVEVSFANKINAVYDFVGHYGSYKLVVSEVN